MRSFNLALLTRSAFQSLLHGSPEAKKIGDAETQHHSRLVARGKYLHAFEGKCIFCFRWPFYLAIKATHTLIVHRVRPDAVENYKKAAYVSIEALAYTSLELNKSFTARSITQPWSRIRN